MNRHRHLYRVRRRDLTGRVHTTRIMTRLVDARRQARRWATWPSTSSVEIHRIRLDHEWIPTP